MNMLIGITNGSDVPLFTCLPPLERDNWIADFRIEPIICEKPEDLYLWMPLYDKDDTTYRPVQIELRRHGQGMPVWKSVVNSVHLSGVPRLVFVSET